jgi:hypothetical protein
MKNKSPQIKMAAALFGAMLLSAVHAADVSNPVNKPNIIFVLADDLGFETLGCYGGVNYKGLGPVRTPNLDAMAKGGMKFKCCSRAS